MRDEFHFTHLFNLFTDTREFRYLRKPSRTIDAGYEDPSCVESNIPDSRPYPLKPFNLIKDDGFGIIFQLKIQSVAKPWDVPWSSI